MLGVRGDCGYESIFTQFCPGLISCSGHGECSDNPQYKCTCSTGWTGADCSEKLCPSGISWFNYPEANNIAHISTYTECSSAGNCNRNTGVCECDIAFTGSTCNRLNCPITAEGEICTGKQTLILLTSSILSFYILFQPFHKSCNDYMLYNLN